MRLLSSKTGAPGHTLHEEPFNARNHPDHPNQVGLHARPAALFVQTAKQFACDIQVRHGERQANAKSILGVLTLGANQGADAAEALAALQSLIERDFDEQG